MLRALRFAFRFMNDRRIPRGRRLLLDFLVLSLLHVLGRQRKGPGQVRVAGFTIHYSDFDRLYGMFKEIFILRIYAFEAAHDSPRIIDAGANIGLATLFYKYQYPQARIIAFEPDPNTFNLLRRNIEENQLEGVELHNTALLDGDGETSLWVRTDLAAGDIGASISSEHRYQYHARESIREVRVPCERLSPYLAEKVDLLKLDIEGSEARVFTEIGESFAAVDAMNMEYHYLEGANSLSTILHILERAGHRYYLLNPDREHSSGVEYPAAYVLLIKSARPAEQA